MKVVAMTVGSMVLCMLAGASALEAHPITKVINMLKKLKEKAVEEGKAEEYAYAKFAYWCKENKADIKEAITDEKSTISVLDTTIAGKKKQARSLGKKIGKLQVQIKDKQVSGGEAKDERKNENNLYMLSDKDYSSTIKACSDAIAALNGAESTTEGKALPKKVLKKAKKIKYVRGKFYADTCAPGAIKTTKAECEAFAKTVGKTFAGDRAPDGKWHGSSQYPGSCFWRKGDKVYFNPNKSGQQRSDVQTICKAKVLKVPKLLKLIARRHVKNLIALVSLKATDQEMEMLEAFAKPRPKQLASGDMKKHVDKYDFKSESVIQLLKDLKSKFEDEKLANLKFETNNLNNFKLAKLARDNSIKAAGKSEGKKAKALANTKAAKAQAAANEKNEQDDLKADSKRRAAVKESCATRKVEWEERSHTREMEIAAMDAAVTILAKATGVRTKAPGNPGIPPSPVRFFQVSQVRLTSSDPKMKAVALLREAAKDSHSRMLERFAMEVSAHLNSPFGQLNNMIEKMIFRLMDEQKDEDVHKLWCDKEIAKSNEMKDDKDDKLKELLASIKVETAAVSKLTEDIKNANKMISGINSFMKEATEIRNVGRKENKWAMTDAQDAQKAISNAEAVMVSFYKESGSIKKKAWEFIQEEGPQKLNKDPKLWDAPYNGVADPTKQPGGIITVLQNIAMEFSKMEAETRAQEQVDQKEYDVAMKANKIEKARRSKEVEMKVSEKTRRIEKITSLDGQKKATTGELEKTVQYLKDLKPACVNGDSSYAERKKNRTKETNALRKAQGILSDAFKAKKGASFLQIRSK